MKRFWQLVFIITVGISCTESDWPETAENRDGNEWPETTLCEGTLRIKLKPEVRSTIRTVAAAGSSGTGIAAVDEAMAQMGVFKVERTFPPAGKFEKAQQAAGLDLWYDLYFQQSLPVTRALKGLETLVEIDKIEPVLKIRRVGAASRSAAPVVATPGAAVFAFNDPLLPKQWHYYNSGEDKALTRAKQGADINLLSAWEITAGHPSVIVAIVDGGIDYNHEDLNRNIWKNSAESAGARNADDDHNGYKDDLYGWNFVDNNSNIVPHDHGTHVAGTVGAVTNNGKGVAGVAGGTGNNDGVRLMSCQIFKHNPEKPEEDLSSNRLPAAIVYGANNGALISQNSWGFKWDGTGTPPNFPDAVKEAIDYFIGQAGKDEKGLPLPNTPMTGGIVVFSAGNEQMDYNAWPAAYDAVVSVAAMGADYKKAPYSNWGKWVDVTAPGGSLAYGEAYAVLSTLPDNQYGYMQGTSMACPHVSGVAALLIAKHGVGNSGFTAERLKEMLLTSVKDIDGHNPTLKGKLGSGYVDAALCLQTDQGIAPDPVDDLTLQWASNSVLLRWNVTRDEDNGVPFQYDLYISSEPLVPDLLPDLLPALSVVVNNRPVGSLLEGKLKDLIPETNYYIAITGVDLFGNRSTAAYHSGSTVANLPPALFMRPEAEIVLASHEIKSYRFVVNEPDEQAWLAETAGAPKGVTVEVENDSLLFLQFNARQMEAGSGSFDLKITDEAGGFTEKNVAFTVLENQAPTRLKSFENLYADRIGKSVAIPLKEYFADADGEVLQFRIETSPQRLTTYSVDTAGVLTLKTLKTGLTTVTVTAADFAGEEAAGSFVLMARDGRQEVDLYPNPVRERLYIRMGLDVSGEVHVKLYSGGGALVLEQKAAISPFEPAVLDV
ncbi:MAG: S8 family serine peptidase, partial [Culturomica sp.]|nr:S8 family serine peptidase [Culturomica sp.]